MQIKQILFGRWESNFEERYNQCINSESFKYFDNQCTHNLNEVFMKAPESSSSLKKLPKTSATFL